MKRIMIFFMVLCLGIFQSAFAKENTIYEISVNKDNGAVNMQLNSDYKEKIEAVTENGESVYVDIKNARLSDNLKTNFTGDISIVSQQIGSKVRIYVKGENLETFKVTFAADKGIKPVDYGEAIVIGFISIFVSFLVLKGYSDTIKSVTAERAIKNPMNTAINLNRQLYEFGKKRSPELVLNSTNPAKAQEVINIQYARDKKNIKIAI